MRGEIILQTVELAEEVLKSKGWAYQFDLSVFNERNIDNVNEHIRKVYLSAREALPQQRKERVGRDVDPIVETMWQHKGFIRMKFAIPILEGAIPICVFKDGRAIPIVLNAVLLSRLNALFDESQKD